MMKAPVQPLFHNIIAVREEQGERRVGMIYLPDTFAQKPVEARVIAIGHQVDATLFRTGDLVIVGRYAGAEFEFNNEKYVVIRDEEVLCKVREDVDADTNGSDHREAGSSDPPSSEED